MSTSANDESPEGEYSGEILKASSPGAGQVEIGMQVSSIDGQPIGTVKAIRADEFLVDRRMARDLWVPFTAVLATEDSGPFHGPVQPRSVVLEVSSAHIDRQGWRYS
jgi:hypothetical protein